MSERKLSMPKAAREALFISRAALTDVYGIPQVTVDNWLYKRANPIPFYRLNRKVVVFKKAEVEAWLEGQRVEPAQEPCSGNVPARPWGV